MAIFSISDKIPTIADTAYVDPLATVTATVTLDEEVSVWPGASIRGDEAEISVGKGSNIQDCAVLHTDPANLVGWATTSQWDTQPFCTAALWVRLP